MGLDFIWILKTIPAAIIGLTVHEYSHAFMSYKLGDSTAREQGRLTLNPVKHIDPVGFFLIIIAGFGWAKPVQFNPENLKNKHRDEILISLAGPLSNLLLGILLFAIARVFHFFSMTQLNFQIVNVLMIWGIINFGLFVFNLIPLPPLDGSHVYMTFLKEIKPDLLLKMYRFGTWILLIIIIIQNRSGIEILPISPVIRWIYNMCISLMGF